MLATRAAAWGGVIVTLVLRLFRRMEVQGDSMAPTLLPGDRLLVLRGGRARLGALVVVADPRSPRQLMVKRVAGIDPSGVTVLGDNPDASTDSRSFGPLARVQGRPVYRYHPSERAGRLGVRPRWPPGRGGADPAVPCLIVDPSNLDLDLDRHLDLERLLADEYLKGLEEMPVAEVRHRRDACDVAEDALSYLRRCVQVKLDIVLADLERRAGGLEGRDLGQVVEQLPEILSDGGRSAQSRGRLRRNIGPDVNYRKLTAELDRIIDVDTSSGLLGMSDQQVRDIADALHDLERRVSIRRTALQTRIDTLQAEIVTRYKSGDAHPEDVLPGDVPDHSA